jgi:phosphatidylinositol glycan class Q protein
MQYLSLSPIPLSLGENSPGVENKHCISEVDEIDEAVDRDRKARLIKKLRLHTVVEHAPTQKELLLPTILNQINASAELAQLVMKNVYLLGTRQKRSLSVGELVVESATTLWGYILAGVWYFLTAWVYPLITRGLVVGLIGHRIVAEIVLRILEWRPHPESAALKDVSATAQQVDIRLQQFCYWPIQYLTVRKRKDEWESITDKHPDYIRFYNSLWLVANDVIIGIALGSYIIDNAGWAADQINQVLSGWTVEGLRDMILWLMNWPAGLKLNNELAVFLGDLFIWVISHWRGQFSSPLIFPC